MDENKKKQCAAPYEKRLRPSSRSTRSSARIAPLMLTTSQTVGATAGHTDVSLWYVINAGRGLAFEFDSEEFHSVRWFHLSEAPVSRSDPHLERFLGKLALASRSTLSHAKTRAPG